MTEVETGVAKTRVGKTTHTGPHMLRLHMPSVNEQVTAFSQLPLLVPGSNRHIQHKDQPFHSFTGLSALAINSLLTRKQIQLAMFPVDCCSSMSDKTLEDHGRKQELLV